MCRWCEHETTQPAPTSFGCGSITVFYEQNPKWDCLSPNGPACYQRWTVPTGSRKTSTTKVHDSCGPSSCPTKPLTAWSLACSSPARCTRSSSATRKKRQPRFANHPRRGARHEQLARHRRLARPLGGGRDRRDQRHRAGPGAVGTNSPHRHIRGARSPRPLRHHHHDSGMTHACGSANLPTPGARALLPAQEVELVGVVVDEVQTAAVGRNGQPEQGATSGGCPGRVEVLVCHLGPSRRGLDGLAVAAVDADDVTVGGDGQAKGALRAPAALTTCPCPALVVRKSALGMARMALFTVSAT